jgi:hypothetical protein
LVAVVEVELKHAQVARPLAQPPAMAALGAIVKVVRHAFAVLVPVKVRVNLITLITNRCVANLAHLILDMHLKKLVVVVKKVKKPRLTRLFQAS